MLNSMRRLSHSQKQDDMLYDAEQHDGEWGLEADHDLPTPTFFPQQFREIPVSRLADRYRSTRDIAPPQPVVSRRPGQSRALQPYPSAPVRAARYSASLEEMYAPPGEYWPRQPMARLQAPAATPAPRRPQRSQSGLFLAAGLAAVVIGGGLGFLTTKLSRGSDAAAAPLTMAGTAANTSMLTSLEPQGAATVRKPITMVRLDVADVSGGLNSMIPLALNAEAPGNPDSIILKLSGLPKSAYLTAGSRGNDGDWQLTTADARDVKLVVPRTDAPRFSVAVAALESRSGELAAPPKEMTVAITGPADVAMVPASAPPSSAKVSQPSASSEAATAIPLPTQQLAKASINPQSEADSLVSKGDTLLKAGDLAMARQFYERAYAEGAKSAAALGAGKTFDPVIYASLKVQGLQPDPQQALDWYQRAKAEGNPQANAAIEALQKTAP